MPPSQDRYRCTDTTAKVTMIPTETIPGHTTGTIDNIIGVVHNTHIQVLIHTILTKTLHTADHLHIGALQLTPETEANHTLNLPTNQLRKAHTNLLHIIIIFKGKGINLI